MHRSILVVLMLWVGHGEALHGQDSTSRPRFQLIVHGGAGALRARHLTAAQEAAFKATLYSALRRGYDVLNEGGTSLDAVQAAIQLLEDSPLFNAGRGAALTSAGTAELDASIMDGHKRKAGAVAGLKRIKNPIALARLVMERTPHVMLAGEGAEALAQEQGMPLVPQAYFLTEERKRALRKVQNSVPVPAGSEYGTVGAVALDSRGRLAAGTSTGGLTNKRPGRIGDSPIVGAGTYADETCAVSATGAGEYFIRNVVAYDICARARYRGDSLNVAANDMVLRKLVEQGGDGGVIALDKHGNVAMPFNTEGMFRGRIGPDGKAAIQIYE
jgi:beta-aspartyl-peptidase (threonine type)